MQLDSAWITYPSDTAGIAAYRTRPAAATEPLPGIVVIQEVWGPDAHICDVADRLATAGYLALAPDLYSHGGRPPELAPDRIAAAKSFLSTVPPAAWMDPPLREQAVAALDEPARTQIGATLALLLTRERPMERYVTDLAGAVAHLRADAGCSGRVGSIGFCLGGGLSARLAATEPAPDGAVMYYGGAPPSERIASIACAVQAHYGGEDERVNAGVPAFAAAMQEAGKSFEHHFYAGAPHAFNNDTRPSYRAGAARTAWARSLAFLDRELDASGCLRDRLSRTYPV